MKRTVRSVSTNNLETSLLATTASSEPQVADTTGRSVGVTAVTQGDATTTLSGPKTLADGSKEYTVTPSNLTSSYGKLGMTVSYTGKKGDSFSMVISPKGFSGAPNNIGNNMRPTGAPTKKVSGNVTTFTWTINDIPDNVTATKTQTIPAVGFFWENVALAYEEYLPYLNGVDPSQTMLHGGESYEIKFLINDQEAPSDTTTSVVLNKTLRIVDMDVAGVRNSNGNKRTTDENYTYTVIPEFEDTRTRMLGYLKLSVPVPEHFLLDEQATKKYIKNNGPLKK